MIYIKLYLLSLLSFLAIDMVWLGVVAKNFYAQQLGYLMRSPPNWLAAIIFYLLYVVGVLILIVLPNVEAGNVGRVAMLGAVLGLIAYATYDLTNLATIKNWPILVTVIDLIWGTVLTGLVASASYLIAKKLGL